MATGTPPAATPTFTPVLTQLEHTEGVESTFTFSITASSSSSSGGGGGGTAPAITRIDLSPIMQIVATASIADGVGTVIIGTSSLYPWTLSFKQVVDNTVITEDNVWTLPPNGAVFNYIKHLTPSPVLTIDVYADSTDPEAGLTTLHQQYTVTVTPDFSAGRDQLVKLARLSPV